MIAGSPRKIFRYRLEAFSVGGRALNGLGRLPAYQTQSNSEYQKGIAGRQFVGDKIHEQEGKSPDHQLRSQNLCSVENDVEILRQLGGWLRSSNPSKKA